MARVGTGPQGGSTLMAARYETFVYDLILTSVNLNTHAPIQIYKVSGPQMIVMTYLNGASPQPSWTFHMRGGNTSSCYQVLPMFPDQQGTYASTNNYVEDDNPPLGCTISAQPIPPGTSRINVFNVTENMTGLGLQFQFAWSPFAPIPPIITLLPIVPTAFNINLKMVFYRTTPDLRNQSIPVSFGAPDYLLNTFDNPFIAPIPGDNPLNDNLPHTFRRYNGEQTISLTDMSTGYFFSFQIDYGIIEDGCGYIGVISPTGNAAQPSSQLPPQNCTVSNTGALGNGAQKAMEYTVVSGDGRTYIFTFYPFPYTQQPPTVQLIAGPPFAGNVMLVSTYPYFYSI